MRLDNGKTVELVLSEDDDGSIDVVIKSKLISMYLIKFNTNGTVSKYTNVVFNGVSIDDMGRIIECDKCI